MRRTLISGIVLALLAPTLAQAAAAQVCLTSARIFSWSAVDDRTMILVDRDKKQYVVKLGGVCTGLANPKLAIAIVTPTQVSCVGPGDRVRFGDDTFGPQACPITSVAAYTPPAEPE